MSYEYAFILPDEQGRYLDDGWEIVGPGKTWATVNLIARRPVKAAPCEGQRAPPV